MAKRFISGVNDFQPTPEELSWQRKTMPPPVDRGNVSFSSAKIPAPPQTPPLQAETPGFADEAKARARAYQAATKAPTGGLGIEPTAPTTASGATGRLLSGVKSLAPLLNPGVAIAYGAGQTPIAQEMRNDANRRLAAHGLKAMFAQPEAPAIKPTSSYTPTLADTGITVPVKSADKGYVQFRTDRQLPSPQDNVRPEGPTSLGTVSDGRGTREYFDQDGVLMVKDPDGTLRKSKWAQSLKSPISDEERAKKLRSLEEYAATRSDREADLYKAKLANERAQADRVLEGQKATDLRNFHEGSLKNDRDKIAALNESNLIQKQLMGGRLKRQAGKDKLANRSANTKELLSGLEKGKFENPNTHVANIQTLARQLSPLLEAIGGEGSGDYDTMPTDVLGILRDTYMSSYNGAKGASEAMWDAPSFESAIGNSVGKKLLKLVQTQDPNQNKAIIDQLKQSGLNVDDILNSPDYD